MFPNMVLSLLIILYMIYLHNLAKIKIFLLSYEIGLYGHLDMG